MSNLAQQELEERWYEEGLEIAEIKGYSESSWDLHAESYVRMIKYISLAEKELFKKSRSVRIKNYQETKVSVSSVSNIIRQQVSRINSKKIDET